MNYLIAVLIVISIAVQLSTRRKIMSSVSEVLKKIDDATTAAGNRVAALINSIKSKGAEVSAEDQAEADAIVAHLTGIAADEANPVPPPTFSIGTPAAGLDSNTTPAPGDGSTGG